MASPKIVPVTDSLLELLANQAKKKDKTFEDFISDTNVKQVRVFKLSDWKAHVQKHEKDAHAFKIKTCTHIKNLNGDKMHEYLMFDVQHEVSKATARLFAERNTNVDYVLFGQALLTITKPETDPELPLPLRMYTFRDDKDYTAPTLFDLTIAFELYISRMAKYTKLKANCFWFSATIYEALRATWDKGNETTWKELKPKAFFWKTLRKNKFEKKALEYQEERNKKILEKLQNNQPVTDVAADSTGTEKRDGVSDAIKDKATQQSLLDAQQTARIIFVPEKLDELMKTISLHKDSDDWSKQLDDDIDEYAAASINNNNLSANIPKPSIISKDGASKLLFKSFKEQDIRANIIIDNVAAAIQDGLAAGTLSP